LKTQLQMHAVEGKGSNLPAPGRAPCYKAGLVQGQRLWPPGFEHLQEPPGLGGGWFQPGFNHSLRPNTGSSSQATGKWGREVFLLRYFLCCSPKPNVLCPCNVALRLHLREMRFTVLFFTSLGTIRRKLNLGRNFCQKIVT